MKRQQRVVPLLAPDGREVHFDASEPPPKQRTPRNRCGVEDDRATRDEVIRFLANLLDSPAADG
jgi:hypothetical protein